MNKRLSITIIALFAALTLGLLFLMPGGPLHAQDADSIMFPENGDGVVAVFTADDPEEKSVTWSVETDASVRNDIETADVADSALFEISKAGELTFMSKPDFEAPAGGLGNTSNTYTLVVAASDGVETGYKAVEVEVTNEEETATTGIELSSLQPQVSTPITVDYVDGVGNPLVDAQGAANTGIEDPDNVRTDTSDLTSAAVAADDVEWQWSKSSSMSGSYTDISGDAAKMLTYTPASEDRDMYLRVTATYEDGQGEGKTVVATSAYPVRAFPSGNSAPAFPDDFDTEEDGNQAPMAEADDGATEGDAAGDPVEANDANNDRLTYSLEADSNGTVADADVFQIDRMTGQVTVGLGKTVHPASDDGETDSDSVVVSDANGFTVTIKATDPSRESATVVMTITVDEVDEAPVFTAGEMSHSHAEDEEATEVVYTFEAYDPEDETVTYSLSGADDDKLSINTNGALTFNASPNFEALGSADGDNVYEVTVKAASTDGAADSTEKSTTVDVTVTVTNIDEDGTVTLSASQPRIGIEIMANTPVDPDGGVTDVTWQWSRADDAAFDTNDNVTDIKDATMAGYTPVTADDDKYLRVTATYTDDEGSGKTAVGTPNLAGTAQVVAKVRNLAPVFTDEDDETDGIQIDPREVLENALEDASVGDVVLATDTADADDTDDTAILYLLSGADAASFDIGSGTGQITVSSSAKLDHETKPEHMVTVTARDPEGLSSSVDVTIEVTDVNEAPEISGSSSEMFLENGTGVVAVFTADDPEEKSVTWSVETDASVSNDIETADVANSALFEISKAGELTFMDEPDFEAPAGGTNNNSNTYALVVAASDGVETGYKAVEVEVTNEEETATTGIELSSLQPQISTPITVDYVDGVGNPLVDAQGAANTGIEDPDNVRTDTSDLTSAAVAADDVEWQWSKSSSRTGTYADITGDDAAETDTYTPASQDRSTYLRVTATYEDGEGEGKTVVATSAYPVRAFTSGNSAPSFPDDFDAEEDGNQAPMAEADDGATEGDAAGDPVEANDANNDRLTYSLEADSNGTVADADVFQIDRMTGQVTVGLGKTVHPASDDGETDSDSVVVSDANGFTVTIKATDPSRESATVVMTITVDEVDEAPVFTAGEMSHSHAEDEEATEVVYTFEAYDPEDETVTYSLSGADDDKLSINTNGALTFNASPNFEALGSADGDNVYEVTVKAASTDGAADSTEKSTTVDVTVTVTNIDEDGTVTLSASQPRIGIEIMANTPVDPDGGVTDVTWQWSRADDAAFDTNDNVTDIKDATMAGYTPVAADDGKYLRVTATYTDGEGSGKTAVGMPAAMVQKVRNLAPVFNDDDDEIDGIQIAPREVAESALEDGNVGAPIVAIDTADADGTDDNAILYLLSGPDASSFTIEDPNSDIGAQIQVGANAKLDHETKPEHMVTVTARDPEGLNSSVDVTIEVTDVNEAPEIMLGGLGISGMSRVDYAEMGMDVVDTYMAVGPDAASAMWSHGGDDASAFSISSGGELTFNTSPDYENPTDADMDNVYMVTVMANDGTDDAMRMVAVTVTNVDELGTLMGDASVDYLENGIDAVRTYTADGMLDASWSLGGDDMGALAIDGSSGELTFASSPDFENSTAMGMDNMYMVTVMAAAGGEMGMMDVTVNVTNQEEDGTVTLSNPSPLVDDVVMATVTDLDENVTGETWQWARSMDMATWTDITDANSDTYTAVTADDGHYLQATATYTDGYGADSAVAMTANAVTSVQDQAGMVSLSQTAPQVGDDVTASLDDPDGSVTGMTWQWSRSMDMTTWTDITDANSATYMAMDTDDGYYLRATVNYTDGHGTGKSAMEDTASAVVASLADRYDANDNGMVDKGEVITAINDYLFEETLTKAEVIELINAYLFPSS